MADVSKFKVPIKSGDSTSLTEYEVKDSTARSGLANKVDKVTGKGLSTNDYTTAEKNKLAGIASGAEVNVQSDWSQTTNTADDFIKNKPTLGTAAAKDIASTGNASTTQVVMGNDTRLTDARIPTSHTHTKSQITDFPTLGTAAAKNVASSGNASSTQVVMGNDTRLSDSRPASDVSAWAKASTKPSYTASEVGAIATTAKGTNNGVAELDSSGKVPSAQLPSFVDDVIEGYYYNSKFYKESAHTTEITGESGKIYVDLATDKTYRWGGSSYVVISETLALGETSTTAYRGDRGKTAYDHSQTTHARTDATAVAASTTNGNIKINGTETTVYTHPGSGTNPHGTTKTDVGLGNVGNFKAVSTVASQGLTDTEKSNARTNIGAGTSSLTIGTTSTTAAAGNHTHSTSIAISTGTNQATLAANTKYAITAGGTSYVFTTPPDSGVDSVKYTEQTLTDAQKAQARANIGITSDEDKLRLGQITVNGKYGFGDIFTIQINSGELTFLTTDVPFNLRASAIYKIGDFYVYYSGGVKISPIAGHIGISKTGQWIHTENCYAMFYNCSSNAMTSFDVSMLDTSEVKNMGSMFRNCTKLTSLDLSTFDTSEVKNMSGMFYGCSSLPSLDLSPVDTGKVENMHSMFDGCSALTTLDLSSFDTSNVQSMSYMFEGCNALTSVNLSSFDTSKVTSVEHMFYGCTALKTLDLSSFDMTNVTNASFMFGQGGNTLAGITTLKTPKINPLSYVSLPRTLYSQDGTAYTKLPVTTGTSIELRRSWT